MIASDLIRYDGADPDVVGGVDFLMQTAAPPGAMMIVTNPPYGRQLPARFAEHGLRLCPRIALLCRSAFAAGARAGRAARRGRLARIHQIIELLPMMHRTAGKGAG